MLQNGTVECKHSEINIPTFISDNTIFKIERQHMLLVKLKIWNLPVLIDMYTKWRANGGIYQNQVKSSIASCILYNTHSQNVSWEIECKHEVCLFPRHMMYRYIYNVVTYE